MPSRMERYYQSEEAVSKRTAKNQELYNNIYDVDDYTNVGRSYNVNEISQEKLNELLKEEKKTPRRYVENYVEPLEPVEEESYDINDALGKVDRKRSTASSYQRIREEQINLLKKIESYKNDQNENLDKLLNTIASTKMLKQLDDKELSLDLLDNLKSGNENTVVGGIDTVQEILDKDSTSNVPQVDDKTEIDKSFFTSSMNFTEEDFEDIKEMKNNIKKNNKLIKIIVIVLILVIVSLIVLLFFK